MEVEGDQKEVEKILKSFGAVTSVQTTSMPSGRLKVTVESSKDLRKEFSKSLITNDIGLLELQSDRLTLEDIFLDLTMKEEEA